MTDYEAIGIAEGFVTNPGESDTERADLEVAAWQHLIDTGLAWRLQGWFGRTATRFINEGLCIRKEA
jgi:hypothetical protein